MSSVDVFQEGDGRWRWQYRDGEVELKSNRTYGDADSAMTAARMAYPEHFTDRTARSQRASGGFINNLSSLMAIVLVVTVWKRRQAASR
jgi:hypothetical protein